MDAAWSNQEGLTDVFMVPSDLLDRYVSVAMRQAEPRKLDEGGRWYADLPAFPGVWAEGDSPKECLDTLVEVLSEWIFVKLVDGDQDIPMLDEIDLNFLVHQR
jgi:predicted RNase H-like HicB family nuclease